MVLLSHPQPLVVAVVAATVVAGHPTVVEDHRMAAVARLTAVTGAGTVVPPVVEVTVAAEVPFPLHIRSIYPLRVPLPP